MTELMHPMAAPFTLEGNNGRAVVLTHGFTGIPGHFRPLGEFLHGHGYTVIAPLLAGHGTAPEDMWDTGRDEWVATVTDAAESAEIDHDEVHLTGLSMGGLLSIIVGVARSATTITTINSPISFQNNQIFLAPMLHRLRPWVSWPEQPLPDLDPEVADLWITYDRYPTRAAAQLLRVSREAILTARGARCPTLVIQSLTDETVKPKSGEQLAKAFGAGCRLVWLERSLHNALLDRERDVIHAAVLERIAGGDDPNARE